MDAGALWSNRHSSVSAKEIPLHAHNTAMSKGRMVNMVEGDPGGMMKVLCALRENDGSVCLLLCVRVYVFHFQLKLHMGRWE